MKRIIQILILLIIVTGCQTQIEKSIKSEYDIVISYNHYKTDSTIPLEYLNKRYLRNDTLYLFFESDFDNDSIIIEINGKEMINEILTTEWSTEVAGVFEFENIKQINQIGIRINNGKKALIETDTMNIFRINYSNSLLMITVPKNVPYYD